MEFTIKNPKVCKKLILFDHQSLISFYIFTGFENPQKPNNIMKNP